MQLCCLIKFTLPCIKSFFFCPSVPSTFSVHTYCPTFLTFYEPYVFWEMPCVCVYVCMLTVLRLLAHRSPDCRRWYEKWTRQYKRSGALESPRLIWLLHLLTPAAIFHIGLVSVCVSLTGFLDLFLDGKVEGYWFLQIMPGNRWPQCFEGSIGFLA